jgi:HEAT repeat protein
MIIRIRYYAICAAFVAAVASAIAAGPGRAADAGNGNTAQDKQRKLIGVLRSNAPPQEKAITCKLLAIYGTEEAVPVLAPLLSDESLASWARIPLEVIPGAAADDALRGALGKLRGRLLVGAINSIGVRRDAKAVDELVRRLKDADAEVASAAAVALGRIGGDRAETVLHETVVEGPAALRSAAAEGCILCAERLLAGGNRAQAVKLYDEVRKNRRADVPEQRLLEATRGSILARQSAGVPLLVEQLRSADKDRFALGLRIARELGGAEVAKALVAELGKVQPTMDQQPPKILTIKKAQYGAGGQWADVTDRLAAAVRNNVLSIEASNGLAGDPAPNAVKELRLTYSLGGEEKTAVVPEGQTLQVGEVAPAGNPRQMLLVYALGDLGQTAALPAVLEVAKSGSWGARAAAVRVLGRIGDASAVPVLLDAAQGAGELGEGALKSLTDLQGDAVDTAIAGRLAAAKGQARAILIQLAGYRGIRSAVPTLLEDSESGDPQVRLAAIHALGMTVGFDNLGKLIERLAKPTSAQEAEAAESALLLACTRMPDRDACAEKLLAATSQAPVPVKSRFLEILAAMGGAKALAAVAAAAKDANPQVQDVASRLLGEWMSADAAPALLDLAKTAADAKYKIRALRGYLRIARQLDLPAEQRVAMCREASRLCQRDEERKLVLEVLRRNPSAQGLSLVVLHLHSAGLKAEAGVVAVSIAEKILPKDPAAVADAMRQVLKAGGDSDVTNRAKALLDRAAPTSSNRKQPA